LSALAFSSLFYSIRTTPQFEAALNKNFTSKEQATQIEDIQAVLKRLDVIGRYQKKWLREKKRFVELERTRAGFSLCKMYVPITCRRLSAAEGARLFVAVKESGSQQEAVFVSILPKARIATGAKGDVSKKQLKQVFKEYT
jgi:hypothetical protein